MRTRSLLPRPEYSRPDRQRSFLQGVDWLNLSGAWIIFACAFFSRGTNNRRAG